MKNKILTTILFFISFSNLLLAQKDIPGLDWKKTFGGEKSEVAHDVISTLDGNIVIVGETTSPPAQKKDGYWLLLDPSGKKISEKIFGSEEDDQLHSVIQTYDGNFVMAGYSKDTLGNGEKDGWLLKMDIEGNILWKKLLGESKDDEFESVRETPDGGLVVVGYFNHRKNQEDMWIYRAHADGDKIWQKSFGDKGFDKAKDLVLTPDGGYAIAGITSKGKGSRNIWLFILDKEGQPEYHHFFGTRQWENIESITATQDGGYALVGVAKTNLKNKGNGLKDMWLIKTDFDGEELWQQTYGGSGNEYAYGITETIDGGFILVGYTFSHVMGANTSKAMILKTDQKGQVVWQQDPPFGGRANDKLHAVVEMQDGGIVMVGTTRSKKEKAKKNDVWAMRMHADFYVNKRKASKLVIQKIELKEEDGNKILEEGENAFILVEVKNEGADDVFDADLILDEITSTKNISFEPYFKVGNIAAGQTKAYKIPVIGEEGLEVKDVALGIGFTDASRTRTPMKEFRFSTKPLEIPSNYLKIKWIYPLMKEYADGKKVIKESKTNIKVIAKSDQPLKRKHFTILINGIPYDDGSKAGEGDLKAKSSGKNLYTYTYSNEILLGLGVNDIEVVVNNGSNSTSAGKIQIEYSNKPNVHIIAVGIEHDDLNFTTNDAKDFAESFKNQEGKLFDKIFLTTLISGQNTKAGLVQTDGEVIKKIFRDIQDKYSYTIYQQDLLLIFISSHGRNINNKFKIIPSDFGIAGEDVLVDYNKDIISQLEEIPCNKLMFIDACQSGTIGQNLVGTEINEKTASLEQQRAAALEKLNKQYKNTNTIASSGSTESSWEDKAWNNGAFTEAIIGAFNNESYDDENGTFQVSTDNKIITFGELFEYIGRRVPAMIKKVKKNGTQNPFMSAEQLMKTKDLPIYEIQ